MVAFPAAVVCWTESVIVPLPPLIGPTVYVTDMVVGTPIVCGVATVEHPVMLPLHVRVTVNGALPTELLTVKLAVCVVPVTMLTGLTGGAMYTLGGMGTIFTAPLSRFPLSEVSKAASRMYAGVAAGGES